MLFAGARVPRRLPPLGAAARTCDAERAAGLGRKSKLVRDPRALEYLMTRFDDLSRNSTLRPDPQLRSILTDHFLRAGASIVNLVYHKRDVNPKAIPYLKKVWESDLFSHGLRQANALVALASFKGAYPDIDDYIQGQRKKVAAGYEAEIAEIDKKLEGLRKAKDEEYNRAASSTDDAAFARLFVADMTEAGPSSTQYVELKDKKAKVEACLREVRQRI